MNKKIKVFFGAAGAGKAYCKHSKSLPDFFIDNDKAKWDQKLNDIQIKNPIFLKENLKNISQVVITSGYIKSILPQLLDLGVPRNLIKIPPKSFLGEHPFVKQNNREKSAMFLSNLMSYNKKASIVSVGGTALGFARDNDFIKWDFDFDLFASIEFYEEIYSYLKKNDCLPSKEDKCIKAEFKISNIDIVPFAIDFFDPKNSTYDDIYEDHAWNWPIKMFTDYSIIKIHGFDLNVPNPVEEYLNGIYGKNWKIPNPNFAYHDYGK